MEPPGRKQELLKTPLYEEHLAAGAVLIDFNGWEMPVRYASIPEEHAAVRESAGLFDLCHMGRLEVGGPDAERLVERLITNHYGAMKPGDARYTLILNDRGTIIDDAIVYKLRDETVVFLVVNASNREAIIEWVRSHGKGLDARLSDRTFDLAMIAIQGRRSIDILAGLIEGFEGDWQTMKYYSIASARFRGRAVRIARTGYTGEDGFEVYLSSSDAPELWRGLLERGGEGVRPIGLGARDTLRLEAGMPLYGNEIDATTTPYEAGLGFAVKTEKDGGFIGLEPLLAEKERGLRRQLKGFRVESRRVARQGMRILQGEAEVGVVTSGAPSPTLGYPIAMGYLDSGVEDERLEVDVRGNRVPLSVVALPFVSRTRKKKQS